MACLETVLACHILVVWSGIRGRVATDMKGEEPGNAAEHTTAKELVNPICQGCQSLPEICFSNMCYITPYEILKTGNPRRQKKSMETENTLLFGAQEWRQLRVSANHYFQVMKMFENEIMLIVRNWVRILRLHILR